jgi:mono/diheme cytochrome c family protein/glucose/arabinose dehydrogenase
MRGCYLLVSMKRFAAIAAGAGVLALTAWWALREPSPEAILASFEPPPAPVLAPAEALASFRVAPGFEIELVAAEPLVVAPVAIDWDEAGRLHAVEMRGFMPNIDGRGEDAPVGRAVVLEDHDGDGRMDASHVLRDGLVLPRALAVLPEGVLLGVPPDLWLCPRFEVAPRCETPRRLGPYGVGRHDPEHAENGLLPALDGWIYNAKSERRFRLEAGSWREERTAFRGQWGIAQDDEGRLYTNHNSAFLFVDLFPADYLVRHAGTDPKLRRPGVGEPLASGATVHGVRVAPGLNRAYLPDVLRPDGRQRGPTAVSGLAVNRADGLGPEARGDVFVAEPAGNVVARFRVEIDGLAARAEQLLSDDPDWGEREFLASTDERFRPVNVAFGPDGALYVVDMYRGVIQHANYASDHLRAYVKEQGLEAPLEQGRIWRVVPRGFGRPVVPDVSRASTAERVALLGHPNGWLRDRAQRWLIHAGDPAALPLLRDLANGARSEAPRGFPSREASGDESRNGASATARIHSLWTLDALGALDDASWQAALGAAEPAVRRAALRSGDRLLRAGPTPARRDAVLARLADPDAAVRLQALHSLGELPAASRPLAALLGAVRAAPDDALVHQAVLSGLGGLEYAALDATLEDAAWPEAARERWLLALASATLLAAGTDPARVAPLLDRIERLPEGDPRTLALARGVAAQVRRPGGRRFELPGPHPLLADAALAGDSELARALRGVRRGFTWPGDPNPPGARALTPEESARREAGALLYAASCAACHGAEGRGQPGLAPSLVGSGWLLDADGWAIRIALHGIAGPLRVGDEEWNLAMPGHGHDPRFTDEALAGLLTHARRAWGHAADPIAPSQVAEVRAAHAGRLEPWRADELLALELPHRLDRYAGRYGLPIVSMTLTIERRADKLFMGVSGQGGMTELGAQSDGSFATDDPQGGALVLEFEEDEAGAVSGVTLQRGDGQRIPWRRETAS